MLSPLTYDFHVSHEGGAFLELIRETLVCDSEEYWGSKLESSWQEVRTTPHSSALEDGFVL